MRYGNIKFCDIANGIGVRTSLFVSGCRKACKGCFNKESWDFCFGKEFTAETESLILESLKPDYCAGLTVLGGEPTEPENQRELVHFLERVKHSLPKKSIWMYTGSYLEDLLTEGHPYRTEVTDRILACVDVLVDGPFEIDKLDISLKFRGSSNQRILDLAASLRAHEPIWWQDQSALI